MKTLSLVIVCMFATSVCYAQETYQTPETQGAISILQLYDAPVESISQEYVVVYDRPVVNRVRYRAGQVYNLSQRVVNRAYYAGQNTVNHVGYVAQAVRYRVRNGVSRVRGRAANLVDRVRVRRGY